MPWWLYYFELNPYHASDLVIFVRQGVGGKIFPRNSSTHPKPVVIGAEHMGVYLQTYEEVSNDEQLERTPWI